MPPDFCAAAGKLAKAVVARAITAISRKIFCAMPLPSRSPVVRRANRRCSRARPPRNAPVAELSQNLAEPEIVRQRLPSLRAGWRGFCRTEAAPKRDHGGRKGRRPPKRFSLFVEPGFLKAGRIVDAIDHCCYPLDIRLAASRRPGIKQDRAGVVFDQFLLDLPYQFAAFVEIRLYRLALDQLVDFGIAVSGVIAQRTAYIVFVKCHIGVI